MHRIIWQRVNKGATFLSDFNYASFIWNVAEKLRGTYRRADNGKVILPFVVLRRLDCALEANKDKVLEKAKTLKSDTVAKDFELQKVSGYAFYNTSKYDLQKAIGDPTNLKQNLRAYVDGFSPNIREIFDKYDFNTHLTKLDEADLLLIVTKEFLKVDLHPEKVNNTQMGHIFEDLIGRAMEASNEEAGEYFTPRDVVRLIVNLLFARDDEALSKSGVVRSIYDPTAGTGGMLSVADEYISNLNPDARLILFGQEFSDESYAIAKTDLIIKGQQAENLIWGDTLKNDGHWDKTFDYGLANPPFGVEWKKQQEAVTKEHEERGYDGRFGPGLPRISDGSLLFLLHLVKKMRPVKDGGGRIGIVMNGSPLFSGGAGSGESEIRKYLIENDLIEAIIGLPKDMFYNTGIATYIWILDNDKPKERKKKIQLIDGSDFFERLRKNVGDKRNQISEENIHTILRLYDQFEEGTHSKIFSLDNFSYSSITVERPLRLNWALTSDRIEKVIEAKVLQKIARVDLEILADELRKESAVDSNPTYDHDAFQERIKNASLLAGLNLSASQLKSLVSGFGERDEKAPILQDKKGKKLPDPELRDVENVPYGYDVEKYLKDKVEPFVDEYWADRTKDKIGYEIPFTRYFYKYKTPRELKEIDGDLNSLVSDISKLLTEVEKQK
jgi:type I restriction enzyme M protein